MKNFIGQDGFIWWIGVVEDINDPLTLGRCKVRCFGYHPAKKTNLVSTEDLPWSLSIHPLNTPNLYGTPKLGDWVFGFFLDSLSAQEPAILGYLPAIPEAASEYFGTASNLTRSFAHVAYRDDILWEVNTAKISIANTGNVTINSSNTITIQSSSNSTFTSNENLTLTGNNNLIFSDSANTISLNQLLSRITELEERLDNPTTALIPNTAITVITDI